MLSSDSFQEEHIPSTFPSPEVENANRSVVWEGKLVSEDLSRADVFSLGLCLYFCLNKHCQFFPFHFPDLEDYYRRRINFCLYPADAENWQPVPFVDKERPGSLLEKLINLMLTPDLYKRPSAGELLLLFPHSR